MLRTSTCLSENCMLHEQQDTIHNPTKIKDIHTIAYIAIYILSYIEELDVHEVHTNPLKNLIKILI